MNVISMAIAKKLGITNLKDPPFSLTFADASTTSPQGFINDLDVRVGNCLFPTNFYVVDMREGCYMPLILGRPFLVTVGRAVDLPNKRIPLSNIDKKFFYKAISTHEAFGHASFLTIKDEKNMDVMKKEEHADKNEINEVLDGDTHYSIRTSKKVKKRDRPKIEK